MCDEIIGFVIGFLVGFFIFAITIGGGYVHEDELKVACYKVAENEVCEQIFTELEIE